MSISEECKAYEKFHLTHYQDTAFPITKSRLLRYIKFRARSSTFTDYLTNLDKHPEHGPEWSREMNSDEDIRKLMDLTINLWPRQAKQCSQPLIGIGNVYETPSFEKKYGQYIRDKVNQDVMTQERVHVVEGKKSRGFMVTEPTAARAEDSGSSSESPINLDNSIYKRPTPQPKPKPSTPSAPSRPAVASTSMYIPSGKYSSIPPKPKPLSKFDPIKAEEAIRDELMQQMLLPTQARLVSQFKPKNTTPKSLSKSHSTPSPKAIKKEYQKSASPSFRDLAEPIVQRSKSETSQKKPIVKHTQPNVQKRNVDNKQTTINQPKKPIIQYKRPLTLTGPTPQADLLNQAEDVQILIERPKEALQFLDEDVPIPNQPVVKIVKRRPIRFDNYSSSGQQKIRSASPTIAELESMICHPVVQIIQGRQPIDPMVKIIKRNPIPYGIKPVHNQQRYKREVGHKHKIEKEEDKDYDDDDDNGDDNYDDNKEYQRQESRSKKQKPNYLFDQNRMQIVQVVVGNHRPT